MGDQPELARAHAAPDPFTRVLVLQGSAGNTAVVAMIARRAQAAAAHPDPGAAGPHLRSALDSRLRVTSDGGRYLATLELSSGGQPATPVQVAEYRPKSSTPLEQLPIYLEDVVAGQQAVVNIRYDAGAVDVQPAFETSDVNGVQVSVRLHPSSIEELTVAHAPEARRARGGVVMEGKEKVTEHSSASATDKIMGSIASAEGGFASVEGSDAGVLTWGQGQWTVTAGELQRVLAFVKDRRQDLFDRYWGAAGLDVAGGDFVHGGKTWSKSKKSMMELFRPNLDRISYWAAIFGQAGMDPQIQRLQREYLRAEVHETLGNRMGGHTPETVLDTRGQAYFYSMDKNLPAGAKANFNLALEKVALPKGDTGVTDEQKAKLDEVLGDLFKNSSVVAYSNDKHHIIAFWGEGGRKKALALADQNIAAGGGGDWSVADWQKYRRQMEARESRYSKTHADIERALAHQNVEPDVPEGAFGEGEPAITAAPAPQLEAAPAHSEGAAPPTAAPAAPAAGQDAGGGLFDRLATGARELVETVGTGVGLSELRLEASVGRGGKNRPHEVAHVRARLVGVGYPAGEGDDALGATIERYQAEVVGSRRPDGRIDPGGPTIHALGEMRRASAAAAPGPHAAAPATPAPQPTAPAPQPATPAPSTTPAPPTETPPVAATGPRRPLQDPGLETVIGPLSSNPAVADVARDLAALQELASKQKHDDKNEEVGADRDRLVGGIKALRAKIDALDKSGLGTDVLATLKPALYRAIDGVSPYYYQVTNVDILESPPPKETRTCNITSLSMALEALGKSPADYKGDKSVISAIAQVYQSKLAEAHGRVGTELTGLRMPDYVELVAIAHVLGKHPTTPEEIQAAAETAWGNITVVWFIVELAKLFGTGHYQYFNLEGGGKKESKESGKLKGYGEKHRSATESQVDWRNELEGIERQLPSASGKQKDTLEKRRDTLQAQLDKGQAVTQGSIDEQLPLDQYKQAIMQGIGPEIDRGNQVVVSLSGHFVRLEALHDDYVIVDDPGRYTRSNRKVTWEEARAMGYFWIWIVVGP